MRHLLTIAALSMMALGAASCGTTTGIPEAITPVKPAPADRPRQRTMPIRTASADAAKNAGATKASEDDGRRLAALILLSLPAR